MGLFDDRKWCPVEIAPRFWQSVSGGRIRSYTLSNACFLRNLIIVKDLFQDILSLKMSESYNYSAERANDNNSPLPSRKPFLNKLYVYLRNQ